MLAFKLISDTDTYAEYEYYPEDNKNNKGVVKILKDDGEVSIVHISPTDEFKIYAMKLFKKLREFRTNSKYVSAGILAWY